MRVVIIITGVRMQNAQKREEGVQEVISRARVLPAALPSFQPLYSSLVIDFLKLVNSNAFVRLPTFGVCRGAF